MRTSYSAPGFAPADLAADGKTPQTVTTGNWSLNDLASLNKKKPA
jgi:hypothetical protein